MPDENSALSCRTCSKVKESVGPREIVFSRKSQAFISGTWPSMARPCGLAPVLQHLRRFANCHFAAVVWSLFPQCFVCSLFKYRLKNIVDDSWWICLLYNLHINRVDQTILDMFLGSATVGSTVQKSAQAMFHLENRSRAAWEARRLGLS